MQIILLQKKMFSTDFESFIRTHLDGASRRVSRRVNRFHALIENYELYTYPLYRADAAYDSDKQSLRSLWVLREIGYTAGIARNR